MVGAFGMLLPPHPGAQAVHHPLLQARVAQLSSVLGQDMIAQSSLPGIPETSSSRRSSRAGSRAGALPPPAAGAAAKRQALHTANSFMQ